MQLSGIIYYLMLPSRHWQITLKYTLRLEKYDYSIRYVIFDSATDSKGQMKEVIFHEDGSKGKFI